MKKVKSNNNGDVVRYRRSIDFNRDTWYDLAKKVEKYYKYIEIIERKIEERISKGKCTKQQVDEIRQLVRNNNKSIK